MHPSTRLASAALLLLAASAAPGVEVVSRLFSAGDKKVAETGPALVKEKEPVTRRTLFAYYIDSESPDQRERLAKTILAYQQKDGTAACAQVIALSPKASGAVGVLLAIKQLRPLAAEVLATRAVMEEMARRRAVLAGSVVDGAKPKASAAKPLARIDADLAALLAEPDSAVAALIAAAYDGPADLLAAAEASPAKGELADACRQLLRARAGKPIDRATAERIVAAKAKDPVRDAQPQLAGADVRVPGACVLLDAFIQSADAAWAPLVAKLIANDDMRVQMDACRAARAVRGPETLPALIAALPGCRWPALVECAYTLGDYGDPSAVLPLIARLKKEKGRFREDVVHALSSIAGSQDGRFDAPAWEGWWNGVKDGFKADPEATRKFRAATRVQKVYIPAFSQFYSLSIRSDRFSFILDTSGSMKENGKIDDLRTNTEQAIRGLNAPVGFNIVDFGGDVNMLFGYEGLGNDRKAALDRVQTMPLSSFGTRTLDSLQTGLGLQVDTLYFLSDGAPNGSQTDDWNGIWHAIALASRHRPVAIHAISFHAGPAQARSMERMALENAGTTEEQ